MNSQVYHVNYDAGGLYLLPFVLQMSTAFAVVWSGEGFAIAADGRKCEAETEQVVDEYTQKIFPLVNMPLAYALTGTVVLTKPRSEEVLFDFVTELPRALENLVYGKEPSLWHFAHDLGSCVVPLLNAACEGLAALPQSSTQVFLVGYYKGHECVDLSFIYLTALGAKITHEVMRPQLELQAPVGYGSAAIFKEMNSGIDPEFEKYRVTNAKRPISKAVEIATNCVSAHCDPRARSIDPAVYEAVGGHIHVAQITEGEGFRWITPPKVKPVSSARSHT